MILNNLDLGSAHPFPAPDAGQVVGSMLVEGGRTIVWARGMKANDHSATLWAKGWQSIGGQTALSINASRYVLRQAEELANNPDLNPVYIRWQASADPAAVLNVDDSHDGWYVITSLVPDYAKIVSGLVPVKLTARLVASGVPRPQAVWYSGGALSTNYSGASQIAIGYPLNSANQAATAVSRTGGEGVAPLSLAPAANFNPLTYTPSATTADWFKAGCHVYDTVTAGGNAVPTTGAFTHANWVEVLNPDHRFEGDCIITNGLHLYRFQAAQSQIATGYVWSTAQTTPGWLLFGSPKYLDNALNAGTLGSYTLQRVGLEEVRLMSESYTSAGNYLETTLRLQRGQFFARADIRPLSQANTQKTSFLLAFATTGYIAYNGTAIKDQRLSAEAGTDLTVQTDYGYGTVFNPSTTYPFLCGVLYQNPPSVGQPSLGGLANPNVFSGDASGPAQNAMRSYGIFAVPFGVSASLTVDKLQAEAESGALSGGWVSTADAAASGGNTAKLPSGTVAGAIDTFGTSWIPPAGVYQPWWRVRNSGAASNGSEINCAQLIAGSFAAPSVILGSAQGSIATYTWFKAATTLTLNGSQTVQPRMDTSSFSPASRDWFIDQYVLAPLTLSLANTGPQEIWQQFLHDRATKIVRVA